MANETITFFCPACGIKLTVPSSLAGVTGPCPSCRTQIQAPIPAAQVPPPQSPPPQLPAQLPGGPENHTNPSSPAPKPAPTQVLTDQPPASPTVLKPEPRQLPNRPHPPEVVAKQMPEPSHPGDMRRVKSSSVPRHPHKTGPIYRVSMLLLFLLASGLLVYGVLKILNMQPEDQPVKDKTPPSSESPAKPTDSPESAQPDKAPGASQTKPTEVTQALPTPPSEQPVLIEPVPEIPEGIEKKLPGTEALEVLEKFLAAKSLAERLPIIETKTPEAELTASCLAGPLPPAPSTVPEFQETNVIEQVVDFYFSVTFHADKGAPDKQTLLVRTRGGANPKVVVDPFLDLFGGRLAAYVAKPTDKAGIFQVIADPIATCLDPKIPDSGKKLTLKLLASDNTKEIALAFFGRMSEIGQMLEDGTHSLSYGKAKACTVMLSWNTKDPNYPYLEAIQLKALDWNP